MQQLTPAGENLVQSVAQRYNLSLNAILHMLNAVNNGGGTMAQFNCPELGGGGQWMLGGMTMVGDMFNYGLKATVDNLCRELSSGLASTQVYAPVAANSGFGANWWPAHLGNPFSSGAQNNSRYAVFPHCLAIEQFGQVTLYDTLDHVISGVSQQQGSDNNLSFSSQYGTLAVASLPVISSSGAGPVTNQNFLTTSQPLDVPQGQYNDFNNQNSSPQTNGGQSTNDILGLIEGLAKLHQAGILSQEEFNAKKADLLMRL